MLEKLYNIRRPKRAPALPAKLLHSGLCLLFGVLLGCFAKWLDNQPINDAIPWQRILGRLDLGNLFSEFAIWLLLALAIAVFSSTALRASVNVLLFFAGMCGSYHIWTRVFSGFDPGGYMMIWYALTLTSPVFAFVCWFGKGRTPVSVILSTLVLTVMAAACFSIGLWYFDLNGVPDTLIFLAAAAVLCASPRQMLISLPGGILLSFFLSAWLPML